MKALFLRSSFIPFFLLAVTATTVQRWTQFETFKNITAACKRLQTYNFYISELKNEMISFNGYRAPIKLCSTLLNGTPDNIHFLCAEIMEVIANDCLKNEGGNPDAKNSVPFSVQGDVCEEFQKSKVIMSDGLQHLSKKLKGDYVVCQAICGGEVEVLCQYLLWVYEVRNAFMSEHMIEGHVQGSFINTNQLTSTANSQNIKNLRIPDIQVTMQISSETKDHENSSQSKTKQTSDTMVENDANQTNSSDLNAQINMQDKTTDLSVNKANELTAQSEITRKYMSESKNVDAIRPLMSETSNSNPVFQHIQPSNFISNSEKTEDMTQISNLSYTLSPKVPKKSFMKSKVDKYKTSNFAALSGKSNDEKKASVEPKQLLSTTHSASSNSSPLSSSTIESKKSTQKISLTSKKESTQSSPKTSSFSISQNEDALSSSKVAQSSVLSSKLSNQKQPPTEKADTTITFENEDVKEEDLFEKDETLSFTKLIPIQHTLETEIIDNNRPLKEPNVPNNDEYDGSFDDNRKLPSNDIINPVEMGSDLEGKRTFLEQEDTHFFLYFMLMVAVVFISYVAFHNKQKIFALIVEGRHERRRRPRGADYKKLEAN